MRKTKLMAVVLLVLVMLVTVSLALAESHEHSYGEWEVVSKPTCTDTGINQRFCSCGDVDYTYPAALGHKWGTYNTTVVPTCTTTGKEVATCENDSSHTSERTLSMVPHQMTTWTMATPATCTVAGSETRKCLTCETENESRDIAATDHRWGDWNTTTVPKCGIPGVSTRICLNGCGIKPQEQPISALEHQWGEYQVITPAKCSTTGSSQRICLRGCGVAPQVQILPALEHSYGPKTVTKQATCVKSGEITEVCIRGDDTKVTIIDAYGKNSPNGHKFNAWDTTLKATCSAEGKQTRTCTLGCGRVENQAIAKLAHTPDGKWYTTEEGDLRKSTKQATTCKVCGQVASTRNVLPKGIKMSMPTYAYGALAEQANPALMGSGARLIWLNQTVDAVYNFPLVTPDNLHIGFAVVTVQNGAVKVSLQKNGETASLLLYRFWQMFPDAQSVTAGKLEGESLPFDQFIQIPSKGCVLAVRTMANYYTTGVNRPFSDGEIAFDGMTFSEVAADMLASMARGSGE